MGEAPAAAGGDWRGDRPFRLGMLALVLVTAAAYHACLGGEFLDWDDRQLVWENLTVQRFDWGGIVTDVVQSTWHPLTLLTYAIEHALFGLDPFWFHATNLALHLVASILVGCLVLALLPPGASARGVALFASFAFALHPLHVESVAWIAERKDVLCAVFFLGALLAYAAAPGRRWLVLGLFVLALLAKPMAVTLPVCLVAIDVYRAGRFRWAMVGSKLPHLALSVGVGLRNVAAQSTARIVELEPFRLESAIGNAYRSLVFYLSRTLWPAGLGAYYDDRWLRVGALEQLLALGLVVLLALAAWRGPARRPVALGLALFGITLLLVLKLVPFGERSLVNDRYTYLPSVGLFLALGCAVGPRLATWCVRAPALRPIAWGLAAAAVLAAAYATDRQCRTWHDDGTLWSNVLAHYPDTVKAHESISIHLSDEGDHERALFHMEEAVRLDPRSANLLLNLGAVYGRLQRHSDARDAFRTCAEVDPDNARAFANLGMSEFFLGHHDDAERHLRRANQLDGSIGAVHVFLARIVLARGDVAEAERWYRSTIEVAPWMPDAYAEWSSLLERTGRAEQAAALRTEAARRGIALGGGGGY